MKKNFLINFILAMIISLSSVLLVSCDNNGINQGAISGETPSDENDDRVKFTSICPSFFSEEGLYEAEFYYTDDYFTKSSYEFDKDLANLSLGLAVVNKERDSGHIVSQDYYLKKYLNNIGFDNVFLSEDYFLTSTADTLVYAFAHKKIEDFDIISVAISGVYGYGSEWANNFLLSDSGHHYGFYENAKKVLFDLKNYVKNNNYDENCTKIWATGYSRGAGIANLFGVALNDDIDGENKLNLQKTDIFVYTFGTPQGVASTYDKDIQNVHNLVNNQDVVTYVAPSEYGFKRAGTDYNIGLDNVYEILKSFDSKISLERFSEKQISFSSSVTITEKQGGYTNAKVLFDSLFEKLLINFSDQSVSIATRQLYVQNFESVICGIMDYSRNISNDSLYEIMGNISQKIDMNVFFDLMSNKQDLLYDLVKDAFDEAGLVYNDTNLKNYSTKIQNLVYAFLTECPTIVNDFATVAGNLNYLGVMHDPITTYLLLKEYK